METKKKKILYHSNFSSILTGFGKNAKNILRYLALTGKYEIVEFANGISKSHPELEQRPWKTLGGIPSDEKSLKEIQSNSDLNRSAQYGFLNIDTAIKDEKPDIYIGVEDIWGVGPLTKKTWWNKINCIVWTTLDSLPILPDAVKYASKIKNYYVWASFAEKAMKDSHGHDHVKTLHGAVDTKNFFKLGESERAGLRRRNGIDENVFVIGFVFRNQLRKSVPNLLEGFKVFKNENPKSNAKLLLHTHFSEGWNIPSLIQEKGINPEDILCTYYCSSCKKYHVSQFIGEGLDCKFCGAKKSTKTVNISSGVSEVQLNEIYNLMDVYCHPFTSGGQEIPIQEAKLTELITLVTNYSCGEDCCTPESGGFALDWAEYREPGTQFIKASTYPSSIAKNLKKVYNMDLLKRSSLGKKARQFVLDNYSIEIVGKKLESILDSLPEIDYDFEFKADLRNTEYIPKDSFNDSDWLIDIYANMLKVDLDHHDEGHKYWMDMFSKGATREQVLDHFKQVAHSENQKIQSQDQPVDFNSVLVNNGNKKALFACTTSIADIILITSLIPSFKEEHPGCDIFFATKTEYQDVLLSNPDIFKVIPFQGEMNDESIMLGAGLDEAYFDFSYNFNLALSNYISIENKSFKLHE